MGKVLDLKGIVFGYLTVIERVKNDKSGKTNWLCKCVCGQKVIVVGTELKCNRKKSCGCKTRELQSVSKTKHGNSKRKQTTAEYKAWSSMKERCLNPKNEAYKNYGARGIEICKRWVNSFENFFIDLGKRPTSRHSLDRINNNGNYEPNNCRWTLINNQNRNKRTKTNSISNAKGVYYRKDKQVYEVRISYNKKRIHIGTFKDLSEAIKARAQAEKKYW